MKKIKKSIFFKVLVWFTAANMVFLPTAPLYALPQGEQVQQGNVTFTRDGTQLIINQASGGAIVNYNSFSIGQQEGVIFNQPGASASILNRVTGNEQSLIAGMLSANGRVYLINQSGVIFTPSARISVGELVASGLNMKDEDFLAGRNLFSGGNGSVKNEGKIEAGMVSLIGKDVLNKGDIKAAQVALAGAPGGVLVDKVAGGKIRFIFQDNNTSPDVGTVINQGTITASGNSGGQIAVAADRIEQSGSMRADGNAGNGGTISLQARDSVVLDQKSVTTANSLERGDGGSIYVVGERSAAILKGAQLQAKGGTLSGNGGFVETSGKQSFIIEVAPDVSAANGRAGVWYIDPYDIEIIAGSTDTNMTASTPFQATNDLAQLSINTLLSALSGGATVIIETTSGGTGSGNITLATDLDYTGTGANSLQLLAHNNIILNGAISGGASDSLNLTLDADSDQDGNGNIQANRKIDLNGGTLIARGGVFQVNTAGGITAGTIYICNGMQLLQDAALTATKDKIVVTNNVTGPHSITFNAVSNSIVTGTIGTNDIRNLIVTNGSLSAGAINITSNLTAYANVTTTNGAVQVAGAITSTTNVTAKTSLSANSTDVAGALVAQGGDISVVNNLKAGSASASGSIGAGSLGVTGTTTAGTNINVTGNANFGGAAQATAGHIDVGGTTVASNTLSAGTYVTLAGAATLGGNVTAQGGSITAGNGVTLTTNVVLRASDKITVTNNVNGAYDITFNAANGSTVSGMVGPAIKTVTVTNGSLSAGAINITSNLTAYANVTTTNGAVQVAGAITSTTNVTAKTSLSANSTDVAGALVAQGGDISVVNNLKAGSASASGSIGAGSLGVTGTTTAGTNINVTGNANFGGAAQATAGHIDVGGTTVASNTLSAGTYVTLAGAATLGGNVTAGSNITFGGATTLTGSGDRTLDAGTGTFIAQSTLTNNAGNLSINGGAGITLANNLTASGETVYLTSTNGAIAQTGGSLAADKVSFSSGQNVTLTNLNINTVAGTAGNSIQLANAGALTIGTVGAQTGLTGISGDVKVKSGGAMLVTNAVSAGADMLLLTTVGDITQNAALTAGGNATLNAAGSVNQNANITTANGDIYVSAQGGSITMKDGTVSTAGGTGNIRYYATNNVALSSLVATGGAVSVVAKTGNITNNTASGGATNITAAKARLEAGGSIGTGGGTPSDTNLTAIKTAVNNLEAQAGTNVYVEAVNGVTLGGVNGVSVKSVEFNGGTSTASDSDLTGVQGSAGVVKIKSGGAMTVSEAVAAGKDVLLLTTAGGLTQNGTVTAGSNVSLIAAGAVAQNAGITATAGDVYVSAQSGSITMADAALTTAGSNALYLATQNIALGGIKAADVRVEAGGDITDAGDTYTDVEAVNAQLVAGGSVGATNAMIDTKVATLAVQAGGNIGINEADDLSVGQVTTFNVNRSRFDSGVTAEPVAALTNVATTGGDIKMVIGGNLHMQTNISAVGRAVALQFDTITFGGGAVYGKTLELNSPHDIGSVSPKDDGLPLGVTESVTVSGLGKTANFTGTKLTSDNKYAYILPWSWQLFYYGDPLNSAVKGARQKSVFDLVKFNPTLLSAQSVFGDPLFLQDNMDIAEPVALGLVDYLLAGAAVVGADPEFPPEANNRISSGAAGSRTSVGFYTPGGWGRLFQHPASSGTTNNAAQ